MKTLRGVNLGSWFLLEGYILGGRNIPEYLFKQRFIRALGRQAFDEFEQSFRKNFIDLSDMRRISGWGANCIRLPFHYRIIEPQPYKYSRQGLDLIRQAVASAGECNLKVILDLHAACGSQNHDWHSDSNGKALLWQDQGYQQRTFLLWEHLTEAFKGDPNIAGFDLLNEPVLPESETDRLKIFYKELVSRIHRIDKTRLLFLKGNIWGQQIDFLEDLIKENTAVSIHTYGPLDFTYNFRKGYRYPGIIQGEKWDKKRLEDSLIKYKDFSRRNNDVEVFVGELGVNYRGSLYGELDFLNDILAIYRDWGFSWTYWTYKAVANSVFPDGIVQYLENPLWVRREGPVYGWENYILFWQKNKKDIINFFKTDNFKENPDIVNILKRYF
jgi:endoglucanase